MNNGSRKTTTEYYCFVILKRCKVQKTDIQRFKLSSLLSWLKCVESRLLLILRSMDASYLSFLSTNNFRCVFRYYFGVNANTDYTKHTSFQNFVCPVRKIFLDAFNSDLMKQLCCYANAKYIGISCKNKFSFLYIIFLFVC